MTDPAFLLLTQTLDKPGQQTLLVLDENISATGLPLLRSLANTSLITNRFDIRQQCEALGLACRFNDFDFSHFPADSFSQIGFRIAKEKSLTHYLINNAVRLLAETGTLLLSGGKNEGIKTYGKNAAGLFQSELQLCKRGGVYLATLKKTRETSGRLLDSKDYSHLRPAVELDGIAFYSKPGVFGWNKIDQGSLLLAEQLGTFFAEFPTPPKTILDLGCGYGFLSIMANRVCPVEFTATDNNAAAIASCEKNFAEHQIKGSVIPGNCAGGIKEQFDAVLCHPPFHQGFDTDSALTGRFLHAARDHLTANGRALFVANRFVPLEKTGQARFGYSKKIAENNSFKVVLFQP